MTGRGIDQALPHPGSPRLVERHVQDARTYVKLAEAAHGAIDRPLPFAAPWGAALAALERFSPAVRVVNLETSITQNDIPWRGKAVHYRMNPANIDCLRAAQLDVCTLANNHVLDWGHAGLVETLETLRAAGIASAGAGKSQAEAAAPVIVGHERRVIVLAAGSSTSGIPPVWEAQGQRPGVNRLTDNPEQDAERLTSILQRVKQPGDIAIASLHWGGNWNYTIPDPQVQLAHLLIDSGAVDIVHGHSSHHAKGLEVYRGKLILYGCGDLLTDYEGIRGHESYRGDIGALYFPVVQRATGRLAALTILPTTMRRFQIRRAPQADVRWLEETLNRESAPFGVRLLREADTLRWQPASRDRA